MQTSQLNCRFVQPYAEIIHLSVDKLANSLSRNNQIFTLDTSIINPSNPDMEISEITLPWIPKNPSFLEIWVDDFRLVNVTHDFGQSYSEWNLTGSSISFTNPHKGIIKVLCDSYFPYELDKSYFVEIDNAQGALSKNTIEGEYKAAYFCQPMVLMQPLHGYARLSDDMKSIIYVPNAGFSGFDSFSYLIVTDRGVCSMPKCVYIVVGE